VSLRGGISGGGGAGLRAVQKARLQPHCDLVAAHDPDPAVLLQFTAATGMRTVVRTFDELLQTGIDFVVLAGPLGPRLDQVRAAAEQGVHCLLHTPMAHDAATAAAMLSACESSGVKLGVAVPHHEDPLFEQVRRMIADDWLGGLALVAGIAGDDARLRTPAGTAANAPTTADLPPLAALAAHHVHLAAWLTGRAAVRVTAQAARGFLPLPADAAAATALLRPNVLCTFAASHLTRADSLSIHGTDGCVQFTGDAVLLRGRTAYDGEVFRYERPGDEILLHRTELAGPLAALAPQYELHGRFARWIDDCDDFPCPGEQAVLDLQVLDAFARAAASGRTEEVG
jgi:predicted dehydrogenase